MPVQVYAGRYTGTQLSLSFFYHLPERFQEVFEGDIVFFGEQDKCCRREEVAIISVFDDPVHLCDNRGLLHLCGAGNPDNEFLHRIIALEYGRCRLESDRDNNLRYIKPGDIQAVLLTDQPFLLSPAEEEVRLFGAHPFTVKGIVIDDLIFPHPVLARVPEWRRNGELEGHFWAPRRIFFISSASSPSPRPSFAISISVRETWSVRRR